MKRKRKKRLFKRNIVLIITVLILMVGTYTFINLDIFGLNLESNNRINAKSNVDTLLLVNYENGFDFSRYRMEFKEVQEIKVLDTIYNDLLDMIDSANNENINLTINNAYRSVEYQRSLFDEKTLEYISEGYSFSEAENLAALNVNKPYYSEHHTGLAIDFSSTNYNNENEIAWDWLSNNAYKYGFILRYPNGKYDITRIEYEPWHYRYVGKDHALIIYENNLTLEEYIESYGGK